MNYDGDMNIQAEIVKIALCDKYQKQYTTLDEACRRARLYPDQIRKINAWKNHGIGNPINEINILFFYFQYEEQERYKRAVYLYEKNK